MSVRNAESPGITNSTLSGFAAQPIRTVVLFLTRLTFPLGCTSLRIPELTPESVHAGSCGAIALFSPRSCNARAALAHKPGPTFVGHALRSTSGAFHPGPFDDAHPVETAEDGAPILQRSRAVELGPALACAVFCRHLRPANDSARPALPSNARVVKRAHGGRQTFLSCCARDTRSARAAHQAEGAFRPE